MTTAAETEKNPFAAAAKQTPLDKCPPSSYQIAKSYFWISIATLIGLFSITILLARNIMQRRRAEKELRESEC